MQIFMECALWHDILEGVRVTELTGQREMLISGKRFALKGVLASVCALNSVPSSGDRTGPLQSHGVIQ